MTTASKTLSEKSRNIKKAFNYKDSDNASTLIPTREVLLIYDSVVWTELLKWRQKAKWHLKKARTNINRGSFF